jgi:FkbH-like protein
MLMEPPARATDFSARLREALAESDVDRQIDGLVALAALERGLVETTQVDHALRKLPTEARERLNTTRLAVLSSSTVDHLLPSIRVAGLRRRLWIDTYKGGYGQYRQEIFDSTSALPSFRPDLVLLSLTMADVIGPIPLAATQAEVDHAIHTAVADLEVLWTRARERFGATVVQQSLLDVSEPLFGNFDGLVPGTPGRLVHRLNDRLADAAAVSGVLWLDVARAAARDGLDAWYEPSQWFHAKVAIAVKAAPRFGELLVRIIAARRGLSRKCLVLDLDNTLWAGVVGDDGLEGIVLGEGSAVGEAHLALQRYARQLKERGVILAVCSRNDPAIVETVFKEHPEMVLRSDDISAFAVNWKDKAENLQAIANTLNIGLDSMVFFDDNPAERLRIRQSLPMVEVPELSDDPADFVRILSQGGYFEAVSFTNEDRDRAAHYAANAQRHQLLSASSSIDEFLRGLNMTMAFGPITPIDMNRAAQLINKTNQFNTTGRRYSLDELRAFCATPGHIAFQFRLFDRFGDNGIVSVMLLRPRPGGGQCLDVECWVMSCRVFGRQLEHEAMNVAVEAAGRAGATKLTADYVPTVRNGVIQGLYRELGFARNEGGSDDAVTHWHVPVGGYAPRPTFIARRTEHA